jgi:hypothetical protein
MVSVLAASAVDRVFEYRSDQTKDYKIDQGKDLLDYHGENKLIFNQMMMRSALY